MRTSEKRPWQRILAVLLCMAMVLPLVPVSAQGNADGAADVTAADSEESLTDALQEIVSTAGDDLSGSVDTPVSTLSTAQSGSVLTNKTVEATDDPNEFVLTLEALSTGSMDQIEVTKPADIVLVLDHSGSMRTPVGAPKVLGRDALYTGGGEIDRGQIVVEKAKHRGYYVAQSKASNSWFIMEFVEEYPLADGTSAPRWVGYLVPTTESIVDTSGGYTEHEKVLTWVPGSVDANLIFYKSQYAVLYDSLLDFADNLRQSGVEHRVAIIGFAGSTGEGSRLYVGGDEDMVKVYHTMYHHVNASESRRTELYRKALKNIQDDTSYQELLSAIHALETNHSFTCPAAGLHMADDLFQANEVNLQQRDRIVVLFTDGIPNKKIGGDQTTSETQSEIFNEIVEKAYVAKNRGAQIYSISTTTLGEGADRTFLSYLSSDYPNAVDYQNPGAPIDPVKYTQHVTNIDDFSVVFQKINQATSSTNVTLDDEAVLREVLTDYFELNPDDQVDVEVYTAAYNGDGTYAEPDLRTDLSVTLRSSDGIRDDIVEVSGFDYAGEYLSDVPRTVNGKSYYGSKLIVKVRVRTRDGFWGGNNVPTNEGSTGIYDKNQVYVEEFPEPQVNVPIDVTVTAKDKTIYHGGGIDTDNDGFEGDELLQEITAGGRPVTVETVTNSDGTITTTFVPEESWMDDFAGMSWDDGSTTVGSDLSSTEPRDYTYTIVVKPTGDGKQNTGDNPGTTGNIAGAPQPTQGESASATGHVYILVPELTFRDSVTDFGTSVEGYDFEGLDFVDEQVVWVDMELGKKPGDGIPALDQDAQEPELELEYTPEDNVTQFAGDTRVDVTVSVNGTDITDLVKFKWEDCTHEEHGSCGSINTHPGGASVHEFWVHTILAILPDTVVIDYGLSVNIDPLTNDLYGMEHVTRTLKGIGSAFGREHTGVFGNAVILEGDQLVQYVQNTSNGMQMDREEVIPYRGTYAINGKGMDAESTITVIPATIIYYEDSFLDYRVYDYETDLELTDRSWESVAGEAAVQDTDRPGTNQIGTDLNNLYGSDSQYTDESGYSLKSYHKLTVDESTYGKATFTFTGTAFDVIALSGGTTGTITVSVYYGTDNFSRSNRVCNYMVDTYYGYAYTDGKWVATDPESPNALYQVPVMKVDLADHVSGNNGYGTYTAVITVSYNDMFDHGQYGSNGGRYDFMLDAIRIYDQANDGKDNTVIENAYKADGEGWPTYTELRDILIGADTFDSLGAEDAAQGVVFIDGIPNLNDDSASGSGSDVTDNVADKSPAIRDYANFGPNNELYLAPGQGVAFGLDADNVQNVHLALKSVGGNSRVVIYGYDQATGKAVYVKGSATTNEVVSTATDLYHDITAVKDCDAIIIYNPNSLADAPHGILSITNIKLTHSSKPAVPDGQTEQQVAQARFLVRRETTELALTALKPAPVNPFADVHESDYYYQGVLWAADKGITSGTGDDQFSPGAGCTRAQVVMFLWRAAGSPEPKVSAHPFTDVQESDYYYEAMLWALEKGVTAGVDDTHFGPGVACSRAQIVTFLWRAAGSPEPGVQMHPFTDVQTGSYYEKATMWAVEQGITAGVAPDSFAPSLTCTRGQVVTFLYCAYTK